VLAACCRHYATASSIIKEKMPSFTAVGAGQQAHLPERAALCVVDIDKWRSKDYFQIFLEFFLY
jgi:hypothetical protein